jgi:response regulator RpfG family c-di-GMP phosphodiesterase
MGEGKKGNLLIVDDDSLWLKLMANTLGKHFHIATATSGAEALEIIKSGFNPGVILSDLNMPNMNGIEFLKAAMQYVPDAIRIIVSAFSNPKEIIDALNQSRAYMYLLKPVDQLNLVQILRNAFHTYNLTVKNNQLLDALKRIGINEPSSLAMLAKASSNQLDEKFTTSLLLALRKLTLLSEKYYYTNHLESVTAIAQGIAKKLHFSEREVSDMVNAISLIHIPYFLMPKRFWVYDPFDLGESDRAFFFNLFKEAIEILSQIQSMSTYVEIIGQIWENRIGSGGPNQLEGNNIQKTAQAIAVANIYHNKVYRIQPIHLSKLEGDGLVIQTKEETFERHNEAIKFFYRKANWFDSDILNTFHSMVKTKFIPEFSIPNKSLTLYNFDLRTLRSSTEQSTSAQGNASENKPNQQEPIERDIRIEKLKPGMIVAQNVVTKTGVLIVRQDNQLDEVIVDNLKYLASKGMIPNEISVYVIPPSQIAKQSGGEK